MNFARFRGVLVVVTLLAGFCLPRVLSGQVAAQKGDGDQIAALLNSLSSHSKTPDEALDPALGADDRKKNLERLSAPKYELTLTPTDGVRIAGDSASIAVRVHFKDEQGNSLDSDATAKFVKRNGIWYFADFSFMEWPAILIITLIVGLSVGVSYAVVVLILWNRLFKEGQIGTNWFRIFIPIFWPALFRQTRTGDPGNQK